MNERKQWFLDRVGKSVYPSIPFCPCDNCKDIFNNGYPIFFEEDALELYYYESGINEDGDKTKFFDTIEERDEYNKTLAK